MLIPMPVPHTRTPRGARPSPRAAASAAGHVGIVDGAAVVRAEVEHLEPAPPDLVLEEVLQLEAGMIGGEGDGVGCHGATASGFDRP